MKRTIIIVSVILAFVLGLTGCDNGNTPSDEYKSKPIVCFGDSLTEGFGATTPFFVDIKNSYPAFLQKKVIAEIVNAGISGDTSTGALARLDKDVLSYDPRAVVILLGANDFFWQRPAGDTKADLQLIIDKLNDGTRKIYFASFIGDSDWEETAIKSFELYASLLGLESYLELPALIPDYRKMLSELILENDDIEYIADIWTGIWGVSKNMSDPIHPNATGYKMMADLIFNEMRPFLEVNNLIR